MVKKGFCRNESLDLTWDRLIAFESAWDHIKVCKITLTQTFISVIPFFNQKKWLKEGVTGMKVWV